MGDGQAQVGGAEEGLGRPLRGHDTFSRSSVAMA